MAAKEGDSGGAFDHWRHAADLGSDNAYIYLRLANVEALAEQPRLDVMNCVQAVVPRMKDKAGTLLSIAIVHWRRQDYSTARQIARLLMDSPQAPPTIRRRARQLDARIPETAKLPAAPTSRGTLVEPSAVK
jgi:hypothetical protein